MKKILNMIIVVFTMIILFYSLTVSSFALTYTNANNPVSIEFTVPEGWEHQDLTDGSELIKARYGYSGDTGEFILFGFCDLESIGSTTKENGAPNYDTNSREYIAAISGVDADTIEIVNYHGIDYYQFTTTSSIQSSPCRSINLICVINTTMFTFQYGSTKNDHSHFSDFEEILNDAAYAIPSDSNDLELYKLNEKDEAKVPFYSVVITIMLYSLPIFIYRYSINKTKRLR